MVVRGDRARLRPCKGLLNGILPVEGAVQVRHSHRLPTISVPVLQIIAVW
jgi:hypothetical protein